MWTASGRPAALPGAGTAEAAVILDADANGHRRVVIPELVDVYADFTQHGSARAGVGV